MIPPRAPGATGTGDDGTGTPAGTTEAPGAYPGGREDCPNCGRATRFRRRGVCRQCYRLLGDAGLPIGDDPRRLRRNGPTLDAGKLSKATLPFLCAVAQRLDHPTLWRLLAAVAVTMETP